MFRVLAMCPVFWTPVHGSPMHGSPKPGEVELCALFCKSRGQKRADHPGGVHLVLGRDGGRPSRAWMGNLGK